MHFVSGIVSFDICAIFETSKELEKTYGIYAKPIESTGDPIEDLMNLFSGFGEKFTANECCTTEYSSKEFKLIKYTDDLWKQWKKREEQPELKWKKI